MPSCARCRQDRGLDAAAHQRIFDLQIDYRMHRVRAADGVCAHFRQADMPDIAGADHVGDGADGVFDRNGRIQPSRAVDIDVIGAEAAQRIGQEVFDGLRPSVVSAEHAGWIAQRAEFHRDDHAGARHALERAADQHLVVTHAVEVAGVDQCNARFHRRADGGDALGLVRRAVNARRHAHAAETKLTDLSVHSVQVLSFAWCLACLAG